jgi:hypothetical protein
MIPFYHACRKIGVLPTGYSQSAVCESIAINATSVACFRMLCIIMQCKKPLQHRHNFRCIRNVELIGKCFCTMRRYLINYLQKIAKMDS